jgi:hypothetical protein
VQTAPHAEQAAAEKGGHAPQCVQHFKFGKQGVMSLQHLDMDQPRKAASSSSSQQRDMHQLVSVQYLKRAQHKVMSLQRPLLLLPLLLLLLLCSQGLPTCAKTSRPSPLSVWLLSG